jgi:hypothetical protein
MGITPYYRQLPNPAMSFNISKYPGKAIVMHSTNHRELQVCGAVTMDMDRDKWRLAFSFSFFFFFFPFCPFCPFYRLVLSNYLFRFPIKRQGLGLCQWWIVQGNLESSLKMTHKSEMK